MDTSDQWAAEGFGDAVYHNSGYKDTKGKVVLQ